MIVNPFLSICIPTWNRSVCLKENILSLIRQIETLSLSTIEIVISDNASTDETEAICRQFAKDYSYINYHRHTTNRGANANFQAVLSYARGDYAWLLGDDDLIVEGIMESVINDIKYYSPQVVIGPAVYDTSREKATHLSITTPILTDYQYFLEDNLIELAGKMSGIIYNRQLLHPILLQAEHLIKTTKTPWPHLVWIILLLNNEKNKMLLLPYGINQLVEQNWHNLLFTGNELINIHFVKLQELLITLRPLISDEFYYLLIDRSIYSRHKILLKCALYSTYLDTYWQTLKNANKFFYQIVGLKNKLYYFVFLIFPLMLPIKIRRFLLNVITFFLGRTKLKIIIDRLKTSAAILDKKKDNLRAMYDASRL